MPVDIKTEEIIKNITKSLAEVYKSYSESIGDEKFRAKYEAYVEEQKNA